MRIAPHAIWMLLASSLAAACATQGESPRPEETDQRFDPIIGGVLDTDTTHDGVVLLYNQGGGMCTGALISQPGEKGVVLTARHCVSKTNQEYVTCTNDVAGDYSPGGIYVLKGTSPSQSSVIGSGSKLFHVGGTSLCNADIAVMVMKSSVSGIEPVKVRVDSSAYYEGEKFTAIGYGLTNPNNYNSAGRRYLRENVSVTDLGPKYYGLYDKEFLGTSSICSGDSGGPAISDGYAVIGVTSRGADCYGNDNIWTRPDGFKDLIDEAVAFAGSSYMDEDGVLHDGSGSGGSGGSGGTGGAGGSGGSGGAAGGGGTGGIGGTGGENPATGGTGGEEPGTGGTGGEEPLPSCGDLGPCPPDATCVVDPATGQAACGMTCNDAIACPEGAVCDPGLGVCVRDDSGSAASNDESGSDGGCSMSTSRTGAGATALIALFGLLAMRRRRG